MISHFSSPPGFNPKADARKYCYGPKSTKSGFTPVDYLFPSNSTEANSVKILRIEEYQRSKLFGFTTRELTQLDAISSRKLRPATLRNGIIPLLRKERWEKVQPDAFTRRDLCEMKDGKGKWSLHNPVVERVMMPSLRLASRVLMSAHVLPWVSIPVASWRSG